MSGRRPGAWSAVIVLLAALTASGPVRASEEAAPPDLRSDARPWTLEEVLDLVREHNPSFAAFEASLEAARAGIVGAGAFPNPEVEGEAVSSRGREPPRERETEFSISAGQPIEWPWKRWARIDAAEAGARAVEREGALLSAALRAETAKAYYAVLFAEGAVTRAEETQRIAERLRDLAGIRVSAGEAAEIDLIKAKVESLKAARETQAERRKRAAARTGLAALTGFALPADYALADPLAGNLPSVDAASALARAKEDHPRVRCALAAAEEKRRALDREEWAWAPDLKPAAVYAREADKESLGGSLGFEIPLWNRNQGAVGEAKAEVVRAEAELRAARQEVERDARQAVESYESGRERLAAFDGGLRDAAQEALRVETQLYEQGEADLLQLLDAQRTAQETEAEYLAALYEANVARAELESALGIGGAWK